MGIVLFVIFFATFPLLVALTVLRSARLSRKLDGIAMLVEDPSQSNSTTRSGKIAATFQPIIQL